MKRAVFLDRDGIINELFYNPDQGIVDSPLNEKEVSLVFGVSDLIKSVKKMGFLVVIISNQPSIALRKTSFENFETITNKIHRLLMKQNIVFDGEYYCLHHPFAKIAKYRKKCDCRKPNIGLFKKAAKALDIDLSKSWMVGDGVNDVRAGKKAECKTILLANINSTENLRIIEEQLGNIKPDFVIKKLTDAIAIIKDS